MMNQTYDKKNFDLDEIYENIYDENEYEAVLIYRAEMAERNNRKIDKEELKDYKS